MRESWAISKLARALVLVMAGLMLAGPPAMASAAPTPSSGAAPRAPSGPQPMAPKVEFEVMVVHASNNYTRVDPELEPVMQHLRFLNYRGFHLLESQKAELSVGDRHTFQIAGGRQVKVELLSRDPLQAKIRVEMYKADAKQLDTTVSIHRDKSFMLAGPKYEDGVLVLPLTARY